MAAPKTRKELLQHLWAHEDLRNVNVFKEGPFYALMKGSVISATHVRCIDSLSFEQWTQRARTAPNSAALM